MITELHELVVQFRWQVREKIGRADEQDGSDLTRTAAHGENTTSEHPGDSVREDNAEDGLALGRAEGVAGFPERLRNGAQSLLDADDNDGQGQDSHSQSRPNNGGLTEGQMAAEEYFIHAEADPLDKKTEAEETKDDGWNTGQIIHRGARPAIQHGGAIGVLREIDGNENAERHNENAHQEDEKRGAKDGRENAALGHAFTRVGAEKFPGDASPTVGDDIAENREEKRKNNQDGEPGEIDKRFVHDAELHTTAPESWRRKRLTMRVPSQLRTNVMAKSRVPRKKRTW